MNHYQLPVYGPVNIQFHTGAGRQGTLKGSKSVFRALDRRTSMTQDIWSMQPAFLAVDQGDWELVSYRFTAYTMSLYMTRP